MEQSFELDWMRIQKDKELKVEARSEIVSEVIISSPPKTYTFNHEVGVDVLEIEDTAGTF